MTLTRDYILANPETAALAGPESDPAQAVPFPLSNDNGIAVMLAAETVEVVGGLSRNKLIQWATLHRQRSLIQDIAATGGHPLRDVALTLQDIMGGALDEIDMADPLNQGMLDAWLGGVEPDAAARAEKRAALIRLATTTQTRWPGVNGQEVARALGRDYQTGY